MTCSMAGDYSLGYLFVWACLSKGSYSETTTGGAFEGASFLFVSIVYSYELLKNGGIESNQVWLFFAVYTLHLFFLAGVLVDVLVLAQKGVSVTKWGGVECR